MSTQSTITQEEKARLLHEALGGGDEWLIIKDGFFYRPNAAGYTSNINDAGRYTRKEAELREWKHGAPRDWVHIKQATSPNYFGSLDVVHEAEKRFAELNPDFWDIYLDPGIGTLPDVVGDSCPVECASAAQRAEALGLALGLWKEGECPLLCCCNNCLPPGVASAETEGER